MTNPANYIDTRKRKSYSQQALFEEEEEKPKVTQPEPVAEAKPSEPPIIIDKKADDVETLEEPKPIEEPVVTQKTEPCKKCKKPITYSSDDHHPGIICPHCKNGQKNPNLERMGQL